MPAWDPTIGRRNLEIKKQQFALKPEDTEGWCRIPKSYLRSAVLRPADKLVYMALLDHIRPQGRGMCFPKAKTLAEDTHLSVREVMYSLERLRKLCIIDWVRVHWTNSYRLVGDEEKDFIRKTILNRTTSENVAEIPENSQSA